MAPYSGGCPKSDLNSFHAAVFDNTKLFNFGNEIIVVYKRIVVPFSIV